MSSFVTTGSRRPTNGRAWDARMLSRRVAEIDHVAVEDDVLLALEAQLAVLAARAERAAREQVLVADDFGADEAALDVGVDFAGRELRRRVARNRPGAALVFAHREERDVAEEVVARANHAIQPGLTQSEVGHERARIGFVELRDLELDLRADEHRSRRGAPDELLKPGG